IYPCRGEYYVLDKRLDGTLKALIYPAPKKNAPGLGIHLTPTVDGNILIGPSAEYLNASEDHSCTADVMKELRREGQELLPEIRMTDYIRNFSGIRPKQTPPEVGGNKDFVIEDRKDVSGFINLLGIESPGLTCAPAIAEMVRGMVERHIPLHPDPSFNPVRPGSTFFFSELPAEERVSMIADNPNYGEIICRCEKITKQEILDAITNPLGARTLVSIKYRARASMGRCQGGFCVPRITRILRDEFGWAPEDFIKRSTASPLFAGNVRSVKGGGVR
ncbi:MAG: FAD-dependent oxidoreductase, partial [Synergistaceae bacterium]|nr:FAD-dependent oxidoreductase [Synergistaceae bacterium]